MGKKPSLAQLFELIALAALKPLGLGFTYYVDATGGSDANRGYSPGTAWQTIAKVNAATFRPGDQILFKRGETWLLDAQITCSQNSLYFGAYGSGAKPIFDGQDTVDCFHASGKSDIVLKDLEMTQGLDAGAQFLTCSNVRVINCDMHDAGNDNLIFFTGCTYCTVTGGKYHDGYQRTPTTVVTGIEIGDDCTDMMVDGAECYGQLTTSGHGIGVHSHAGAGMPNRITIKNCLLHDNAGHGLQVLKQDDTDDTGDIITLENNLCYSNALDGIRVYKSAGAAQYPNGVVALGNYCYGNAEYAYYYSGDNLIVKRNKFSGRGFLTACINLSFYNNTMYFTTGAGLYPMYINNARSDGINIKNNIVHATVSGGMMIGVDVLVTSVDIDIDYNLYYLAAEAATATRWHWKGTNYSYANWLTNSGQDANSPTVDENPLLVDPANGDYNLSVGSPAIDAGVAIDGVTDGFEGVAPDCGYAEKA